MGSPPDAGLRNVTHYRPLTIAVARVAMRLGSCFPHGEGYEEVQERLPSEVAIIQIRVSRGFSKN